MAKLKKILFISVGTLLIILTAIILFSSSITKYLIEKYDEKYTGRQITLDWAYVNLFTGYIHFNNLKIYELKSDSIFFSANGLSANFAMFKLFSKTYEVSSVTLNHPYGTVIQNKKQFNFDDLIQKFSPTDSIPKSPSAPVHFSILDIKINDGVFRYLEKQIPINYFIKNVNMESPGLKWNVDTIAAKFSFLSGIRKGDLHGNFSVNMKSMDYLLNTTIHNFDLDIIEQYLNDITNYGSFRANLDANIKAEGNFKNEEEISTSGVIAVNDFHFGKNPKEDYVSFDKLIVSIENLNPKSRIYSFDSISLNHPYFKYERYDHLDNVQTIFGENGSNIKAANADASKFNLIIEIGNYIKDISRNFFHSPYKVDRLAVYKADLRYNDYSLSEEFSAGLSPLTFTSDSIDKSHKRVELFLNSGIKPYGKLSLAFSINPKDSTDFDINCRIQNIPVSVFNPYVISFTSFPLDRGTLEFSSMWNVRNGIIQSNNHLIIVDPRLTKRVRNKDTKWIPAPLIMAFIRERGNVIDYEIPITGNLKNPKFHFKNVIVDLIENIFVKPVTTPYILKVKNIETEIENSLTLKWQMRNNSLQSNQERFVKKLADFLAENSTATVGIYPQLYALKEKEHILFFEAKKKYFLAMNHKKTNLFSSADSEKVDKMSVKDSFFVHYLNKHLKNQNIFTIQEKCAQVIDSATINAKFNRLNKERENTFISYFKERKVENQVKIYPGENIIPYNGFSYYKIEYKGELPEALIKAYLKMNELNEEEPRKKFKKEREKYISTL